MIAIAMLSTDKVVLYMFEGDLKRLFWDSNTTMLNYRLFCGCSDLVLIINWGNFLLKFERIYLRLFRRCLELTLT